MPRYAETEVFEICPEGTHLCSLNDIKDVRTSNDKAQWNFVFETEDIVQNNGRPFMLFARCFTNVTSFCKTFDPNNSWTPGHVDAPSFDFDTLIGNYYHVQVAHIDYKGKTYANVISIMPTTKEGIGDPFAGE